MSRRTFRLLIALATVATVFVAISSASAQPAVFPGGGAGAEHARIVDYWSADRVAGAIPRDIAINPTAKPDNPGGGNGGGKPGGNDGDGGVTGASWTGGGTVKATTGKVLFTLGGIDYVCSGSTVDDSSGSTSLVLTAGHCVYDEGVPGGFATNWMFVPDYETAATFDCASTAYGCWTATALVTTMAWSNSDFNHDYAFAVLGAGGHSGSTQLDTAVGTQSIAFNQSHPADVYSFGYPHASPYDGQDLVYCAGTDQADTWGGSSDFGLVCDMTGGSSGGPWFIGFDEGTGKGTLTSINSFKYTRGKVKNQMFGPYFGAKAAATYSAAQGAAGNTLVP